MRSSYPKASKHHYLNCLNTLHVLFVSEWVRASSPVCINTGSSAFKYFDALSHTSNGFVDTSPSIAVGSLPLSFLQVPNFTTWFCLFLERTSSGAVVFALRSLSINGLQLNHTRRMSLCDLQIQQASTVWPVIQLKYSSISLIFNLRLYQGAHCLY